MRQRAPEWRRAPERPFVLGHRGARHAAPENTLAAFDLALDEGADGVELDVRLDGAGRVVVLHDPTLERVTSRRDARRVETLGAAELSEVDVGGGQHVPTLEDVVAWSRRRDARVNVELKHDVADRMGLARRVAELVEAERPDRFILSSFHPGIVRSLVRLVPRLPVAWLVHDGQRLLGHAPGRGLLGVAAIHPQTTLANARRIRAWLAGGYRVNVWTVNDPDDARRLDALGVDTLISDNPGRILAALRR